jgi:hypothetical protein
MSTVERQFPTEEEVDQWMKTHLFDNADVDGNPELDQLPAATKDTTSRLVSVGPGLVASGHADTFYGGKPERNSPLLRGAVPLHCCAALCLSTVARRCAGILGRCQCGDHPAM